MIREPVVLQPVDGVDRHDRDGTSGPPEADHHAQRPLPPERADGDHERGRRDLEAPDRADLALGRGRRAERVEERLEQGVARPPAGPRREPHRVGALGHETDSIVGGEVLAGDRPRGPAGAQDEVLANLGLSPQRIREGVEHDHHVAGTLRMTPVHVRFTAAQRGTPVEIAHPVARLVGADLGEVVAVTGATPGGVRTERGVGRGGREQLIEVGRDRKHHQVGQIHHVAAPVEERAVVDDAHEELAEREPSPPVGLDRQR